VRNALQVLKSEGFIYGQQGVGSYVRDRPADSVGDKPASSPGIAGQLDAVLAELRQLALRVAHIEELLTR